LPLRGQLSGRSTRSCRLLSRGFAGEHRHQLRTEAAQMHKFRTYHSNRVRPWLVAPIGG